MRTIYLTEQTHLEEACAATIGFFDGVHRGHRYLLEQLKARAAGSCLKTMAITFDRHPRQVLHPDWRPLLLSSLSEKEALLGTTGIDLLVVLPFDERMAALSARSFMRQVLSRQLGVRRLLTGYDNHFGHRSPGVQEGFSDYVAYGSECGMQVEAGEALVEDGRAVSSSLVRSLLTQGDVSAARRCLGRSYQLSGHVVSGHQNGRRIGFPTANLQPADDALLVPGGGVYAVSVTIDDDGRCWPGMTNIGLRPTFTAGDDTVATTIETHIFGLQADLYDHRLRLTFEERLRSEQRFSSPEALTSQMAKDAAQAQQLLSRQPFSNNSQAFP